MKKISYKFFQKFIANFVIILAILCLGLITYQGGTQNVFSSYKVAPIYSGNPKNSTISLMFNVYMGNEYVEQILQILEKWDVKATFFVGGIWVEKNEDCFMKIYNSGNEIGSHGYWHKEHSKITDEMQLNEIKMTAKLINDMIGVKMSLFAPPSGDFNKKTPDIAESQGYKTILWTKDTIDWRDQDVSVITQRATKNARAGDFVLMHPTKATCEALENIIKEYQKLGLKVDTVSKNLLIDKMS